MKRVYFLWRPTWVTKKTVSLKLINFCFGMKFNWAKIHIICKGEICTRSSSYFMGIWKWKKAKKKSNGQQKNLPHILVHCPDLFVTQPDFYFDPAFQDNPIPYINKNGKIRLRKNSTIFYRARQFQPARGQLAPGQFVKVCYSRKMICISLKTGVPEKRLPKV